MKNFTNYHIMENNGMEEVISMIFQNNKNSRRNNTICRFSFILLPLQERSIYFLAPESDGAVFRLHSNIVVSSLRWRNDLSLSEKTINVSRWGTIYG